MDPTPNGPPVVGCGRQVVRGSGALPVIHYFARTRQGNTLFTPSWAINDTFDDIFNPFQNISTTTHIFLYNLLISRYFR